MAENNEEIILESNEVTIEIDDGGDNKPINNNKEHSGNDDNNVDDSSEREKKRLERKQRLQRQRDARARNQEKLAEQQEEIESLRAEMAAIKNSHSQLTSQASEFYKRQLEEKIITSQQLMQWYQNQLADAVSTADGQKMAEMNALIEQERTKLASYGQEKHNISTNNQQQFDPRTQLFEQRKQRHQQRFISENSDWFTDPAFSNERKIAESIDAQLAKEMIYTADQPEYWNELNYRIKNHPRLKDIVGDDYNETINTPQHTRQNSNQKPITGGSGSVGTPGKVRLKFEPHHMEGLRRLRIMDNDGKIIKGQESRAIAFYENIVRIRSESNNR